MIYSETNSHNCALIHVNHSRNNTGNSYGFRFGDKLKVIYKSITEHGWDPEFKVKVNNYWTLRNEKRSQIEGIGSQVKYKQENTLEKTPILKFRFEFEL